MEGLYNILYLLWKTGQFYTQTIFLSLYKCRVQIQHFVSVYYRFTKPLVRLIFLVCVCVCVWFYVQQ